MLCTGNMYGGACMLIQEVIFSQPLLAVAVFVFGFGFDRGVIWAYGAPTCGVVESERLVMVATDVRDSCRVPAAHWCAAIYVT